MHIISHTLVQTLVLVVAVVFLSAYASVAHAQTFTPQQIERVAEMYFKDAPVMVDIARCESGMRHYTDAGNVLRGGTGGAMIGLFQLSEQYHRAPALALGLNIDSLVGNLLYAKHLYQREGTTPWQSCVPATDDMKKEGEDTAEQTTALQDRANPRSGAPKHLTQRLTYGSRHAEVTQVQHALTAEGYLPQAYTSAQFDIATMQALVRFQCKHHITCGPNASFAEYGTVGEQTRALLNAVLAKGS